MPRDNPLHIRQAFPDSLEGRPDSSATCVPCAKHLGPGGRLEHAVFRHQRHDLFSVMIVERPKEIFQKLHCARVCTHVLSPHEPKIG